MNTHLYLFICSNLNKFNVYTFWVDLSWSHNRSIFERSDIFNLFYKNYSVRITYADVIAVPDLSFNGCGNCFAFVDNFAHIYRNIIFSRNT